jgi:hypothetical protein
MITREAFEFALDTDRLDTRYYEFLIGDTVFNWHRCRRAGKTRIFTRDHDRVIIPVAFKTNDLVKIAQSSHSAVPCIGSTTSSAARQACLAIRTSHSSDARGNRPALFSPWRARANFGRETQADNGACG